MLHGINTSGRYLQVTGGSPSTYINKNYATGYMQGDMRYDLDSQCIKVWDGMSWQTMVGGNATVELTYEAEKLLDWAREKKNEEALLDKMAQESPAIRDLVGQIKEKQEQIKVVQTLMRSHSTSDDQGMEVQAGP